MDSKPMQGKVAIVTGGAGGIGKAISIRLAKAGATVIIFGRNVEKGNSTLEKISAEGGTADFYRTDLMNAEEIQQSMKQVLVKYEKIDILVNNAGVSGFMGPVVDTPIQEVENVLKVNLTSIFHLSQLVLPKMIENGYGRIVNISSVAPRRTPANSATYNMSKAGVDALTKTLSREVAAYGITVNAVAPGLVMTERIIKSRLPNIAEKTGVSPEVMLQKFKDDSDTRRLTREEDVAELVMFLASKASQNITGEVVNVAGGY